MDLERNTLRGTRWQRGCSIHQAILRSRWDLDTRRMSKDHGPAVRQARNVPVFSNTEEQRIFLAAGRLLYLNSVQVEKMFGLPRILTVYAIAIPLALVLGYALSTPNRVSYVMVGLVLFVLLLPLFIQWHHILLICFWNSAFNFPFLPSQPHFWLLLAVLSFGISWLNGLLGRGRFLRAPELTRPLVFLGIVVFVTGYLRGGIGLHAFGSSSYGGKSYFYIFGGIIGYFALTAVRIPLAKAYRASRIYFLSGMTFALPNLVFLLGPAFYFLFYLLPGEFTGAQAVAESGWQPGAIERLGGITPACTAVIWYLLVRWGIRGVFSVTHPWRAVIFVVMVLLSLMGGFRSGEIIIGLLFVCLFFVEGLWRTRFLPILLGFGVAAVVMLFAFAGHLPLAAQRAVSFLPVKVDPGVKADADYSAQWRFDMWRILAAQIPKYLLLGKGYRIDPEELYLADLAAARGEGLSSETAMVAGDYHSGPLSTIIPLGLWGVIGLLWLLGAGVKVLYQNYRYGDPALQNVNAFLLAFFIMQIIMYFGVFGAFNSGLYAFTGILGLSVSINGGVRKAGEVARARAARPVAMEAPLPVQA